MTTRTPSDETVRPRRATRLLNRRVRLVSFDVFDTALIRRVVEPNDVHFLTANRIGLTATKNVEHYVSCRLEAEQRAREQAAKAGRTEVGIAEISSELEQCLPPELFGKNPIKTELKLEQELAAANPEILAFHQKVRRKGLAVAFTADTSLPHGVVAKMLRSAGYDWDHLFLSSQTGRTKQDGSLFTSLVERTAFGPDQILHIGEVEAAGVNVAAATLLSAPDQPTAIGPVELCTEPRTGVDSVALSLAATHQSKVADKVTPADIGYYSLGPMMAGFIGWVAWQTRRTPPDHVVVAPRLYLGEELATRVGTTLTDRIRPSQSLWDQQSSSSDHVVEQFLRENQIQPGDHLVVLDVGWDDKNVSYIESLLPPELNISVSGYCLGLLDAPTSDTEGWAFTPTRNTKLAERMKKSDFIGLLVAPRQTNILHAKIRELIDEIATGIVAFAEDIEPWINLGPTTASLCWPALRTVESPTYAEAQQLTDGWTRRNRSIGSDVSKQEDPRPLKSRLVRSLQLRSELQNGKHLGSVWEQGSQILESGGSIIPSLPTANKRLALRSLRLGQRRTGTSETS